MCHYFKGHNFSLFCRHSCRRLCIWDSLGLLILYFCWICFFLFVLISCSLYVWHLPSILLDRKTDKLKNGDNLRGCFMSKNQLKQIYYFVGPQLWNGGTNAELCSSTRHQVVRRELSCKGNITWNIFRWIKTTDWSCNINQYGPFTPYNLSDLIEAVSI